VLGVAACLAAVGLVMATNGVAFTGTPAALRLARRLVVAIREVPAVGVVPSGYVAYCPAVPLGWINVPVLGCREHAHVSEELDLSGGRLIRSVGEVRARSQPTIRSVGSSRGWFQHDDGLDCWLQSQLPFISQSLVGYPYPGERIRIVSDTVNTIVIGATAPRFHYRELDYINRATNLIYRVDEFNSLGSHRYRETDHLTYLTRQSRRPSTTPICA
jgi:hypothetical protein